MTQSLRFTRCMQNSARRLPIFAPAVLVIAVIAENWSCFQKQKEIVLWPHIPQQS